MLSMRWQRAAEVTINPKHACRERGIGSKDGVTAPFQTKRGDAENAEERGEVREMEKNTPRFRLRRWIAAPPSQNE